MKKRLCLTLALCLMLGFVFPAQAEESAAIPDVLRFTQQEQEREYLIKDKLYILRTYPETVNAQVNAEMRAQIDRMVEQARPFLPTGKIDLMPAYLDVGAYISRTGARWMSFLSIARIAYEREQIYVDFDARVYDMASGQPVTLGDLFPPDSEAWPLLERAVREQLTAYFLGMEPEKQALDALCDRETIARTPFTLTPAKLSLHYRADALYAEKNTLMHVNLYYSALRPLMTALGREMTDNSMYKLIALTYDDGGARNYTNNLLNTLRLYGADATFFIVGERMRSNHDMLCRQQDAGFVTASHNYIHTYEGLTNEKILTWKAHFDEEMNAIIGVRPPYMRAPGGHYWNFVSADVGLPLIQWSAISGDMGNSSDNVQGIAQTVINTAKNGGITLMHDLNPKSHLYTAIFLPELEKRGFLCVTVDELFDSFGISLLPNQVYYGYGEENQPKP